MPPHLLSKTSFLKFEQCPKAFFFYRNLPYLKDKVSKDKELTFKRGHDVGHFAHQLFPGGIDVDAVATDSESAIKVTMELVAGKTPVIYEAAFMFNHVLIRVDILCLTQEGYTAYEVKSSLRVSEFFLRDACLQYYVLKQSLPGFLDLHLVTINGDYVKQGSVEPKKLFKKRSIKEKAEQNFSYIDLQVKAALLVLEQNKIPNIPVGPQCFKPYQCDFFGICWKEELGEKSVFNFPQTTREMQFDWHRAGMKLIDQVPDEVLQKESLLKIKNAILFNTPFFSLPGIKDFLAKVKEPVAAMDMEIWNPAIPQLDGSRPFEQIPFLAGFYDGRSERHYFAEHKTDQREELARALLVLSADYNTILTYDKNLEMNMISALQQRFPQYRKELDGLKNKIVDVFDVFLRLHYYHPSFRNSFSLKVVSAVLLGDVNYGEIVSGLEAMSYFDQYRMQENPLMRQELYDKLVHYCSTDCRATMGLYEFLKRTVEEHNG